MSKRHFSLILVTIILLVAASTVWLGTVKRRHRPSRQLVDALLLKNGIDVDARDNAGQTPLMWACMDNEPDMVSLLLANGARVDLQDDDGCAALYYTVWAGGNEDIFQQLLQQGADPNLSDKSGQSAAAMVQNSSQLRALLRKIGSK